LAQKVKKDPHDHCPAQELEDAEDRCEMGTSCFGRPQHFGQTGGTEDTVFMFGNAFPAEIPVAGGASRGSLTVLVMETPLVGKRIHV
jgi:hypothetical protein